MSDKRGNNVFAIYNTVFIRTLEASAQGTPKVSLFLSHLISKQFCQAHYTFLFLLSFLSIYNIIMLQRKKCIVCLLYITKGPQILVCSRTPAKSKTALANYQAHTMNRISAFNLSPKVSSKNTPLIIYSLSFSMHVGLTQGEWD